MKRTAATLAAASIIAISAATPAFAQDSAVPPTEEAASDEDIVVTGTQIRGIEPVGSNVTGLSSKEIRSTGVTDSNQLLGQLPQSNFFLALPEPGGGVIGAGTPRVPLSRPNLRNLPLGGTTSGALTLVMLNGGRIVPAGIEQSVVDAGVVPPSMLDRLEAILDGASAVYGSDAVGGVINYIPRKRFDGAQVAARYGLADDFWQTDASVTAGTTWGSGGFSASYEFAKSSNILNGERAYEAPTNWINPRDATTGVPTTIALGGIPKVDGLSCDVANVRQGTSGTTNPVQAHVSGSGLVAGPQFCAANEFETFTPAQTRHSVFAVLQQDLTDWLRFDMTGFYSNRLQKANEGPFRGNGVIIRPFTTNGLPGGPANAGGNPFFRCGGAVSCTAAHRVDFSYGPAFGNDSQFTDTTTEIWQVTPTLTADLGSSWQARGQFSYGRSHVKVEQDRLNTVLQSLYLTGSTNSLSGPFPAQLTIANAINPYDIASSNRGLLDSLVWRLRRDGIHTMKDARVVADGPLFTLPGGDVSVAVGVEWMDIGFRKRNTTAPSAIATNPFGSNPPVLQAYVPGRVKSKSAFGELVVPLFGPDNATPGFDHLTLSASARYDDYGNAGGGDTVNPKFGVTYGPFDWITFRANWGKSFRAPNGADKAGQAGPTATVVPGTLIQNMLDNVTGQRLINPANGQPFPCFIAGSGGCLSGPAGVNPVFITLGGTDPDLKPETSTNWAIGGDISPPFIRNLKLSVTYWSINFKDIIALPQTSVGGLAPLFSYRRDDLAIICRSTTDFVSANPCKPGGALYAAAQAFVSSIPTGQAALDTANALGDLAYIVDPRTTNTGIAKVRGIDASATYLLELNNGSLDFSVNGAWVLKANLSAAAGAPFVDQTSFDTPKFRLTARMGATIQRFRFQASYRHQAGYVPSPGTNRSPSQTHIEAFDVIDLAFTYDLNGTDIFTRDLQFSLNVNNVLGAEPTRSLTAGGGSVNGQTLGRVFLFGFNKGF